MAVKRYALVGASGRATYMFAKPMVETFGESAEVVGVFDTNPLRIDALKELSGAVAPSYTDCDKMLAETKPDAVIITTMDRYHHEYAIKAMEAGADVITEKPMTIDADKCNAILEAEKRTGRKIIVTFNYRYAPFSTAIKQAIMEGAVGEVLSVHFEYLLDTSHGADYFRRWHRRKENSGGLLVHKATHHFDLVNWWIQQEPEQVMAYGTRRFYGPTRKERGERCHTCQYKKTCEFYWDITADPFTKRMYFDCESADGYYRDRCVFADEIDIEDSMSVNVRYNEGAIMSYSLTAHSPWEGYRIAINGTNGRLEANEYGSGVHAQEPAFYFDVFDRRKQRISYTVPKATGGHGGGDDKLLQMLFEGAESDPLGYQAGSYAGAVSILTGIAANKSIATGSDVLVKDLVDLGKYRK